MGAKTNVVDSGGVSHSYDLSNIYGKGLIKNPAASTQGNPMNKSTTPKFSINHSGTWTPDGQGGFKFQQTNGMMDYIGAGAQVFNAAAAGMNAYTGIKSLGLAKDEFGFKVAATNRDVANQGKLVNNDIINSNNVGLMLAGNTLSPEQQAASKAAAQSRQVNTSKIG